MKHPKLQKIAGIALSVSMLAATAFAGEMPYGRSSGLLSRIASFFGF